MPTKNNDPMQTVRTHNSAALAYEHAVRYVHDQADRGGALDAGVFRAADWSTVSGTLAKTIELIAKSASGLTWSDEDRGLGGIEKNFTGGLRGAQQSLTDGSDPEAAFAAVAQLTQALKALLIKVSGETPPQYRGATK